MRKIIPASLLGFVIALTGPSAYAIPLQLIQLNDNTEVIEDFSGQGSEYAFTFTVAPNNFGYLEFAFGSAPIDEFFQVNVQYGPLAPNGYNITQTFNSGTSEGWGALFTGGPWDVYVTLIGPSDPFGGIELSDIPLTLPNPDVAATPLPGALPLFAAGLAAFGLVGARRRRKAS